MSDSSTFTTILSTIPAQAVILDSNVEGAKDLLPAIFQLPQVPDVVTIRDDNTDALPAGQEKLVRVGSQVSESEWGQIIQQNITLSESIQSIPEPTKKDKILVVDDVVELIDMYKIMFEMKGYEVETAKD